MDVFDPEIYHRRSIRLKGFDYSQPGAYFITVNVYVGARHALPLRFGEITNGLMNQNEFGGVVKSCWEHIPEHFPHVQPDAFIAMPNHVHGIVMFLDAGVGARHALPLRRNFGRPPPDSLSAVIGSFKSAATRGINLLRGASATPVWQRNYYEHVIRTDDELNQIRQYILDNPARWASDLDNPESKI